MSMDFEQVEDAIVAEQKEQLQYLRTCETYVGQLDGDIDTLPINYPACFVSFGGSKLDWADVITVNEAPEFSVLLCAKNLRSQEDARKADGGVYQMIRDTLTALTNQTLGLDIEKLRPTEVALVYISKTVVIYGIKFQTNFDNTYD